MRGDSSGNLHEDRPITRAEFVTLVNRAFGYTETGPNTFADVRPNAWYAEDISIAHQAGYFNGTSPTTADPMALVTREQAAVLLGRCLRFQGVTGAASTSFTDMYQIGGWSRGLVQEAADLGIIQGYADGTFKPDRPITRGQMACFLVRALGTLVQEPGEQTSGGVYGNLTITTPGVKLKDTTVTGNLYLTGGVGLGSVELENVTVLGKIIICGGGEAEGGKQSVLLRNVTAGALELDSLSEQFLSVQAEGLTNIGEVTVRTSGYLEDRTEDGLGFQTIRLDGIEDSLFQLAGNIKRVVNMTPGSTLQMAQGVADVITMDERAVDAKLTIDDQSLLLLLKSRGGGAEASKAIEFSNQLAAAAARAFRGEGSAEVQQAFQNLLAAMLLNESVYMPINHYLLPLEWDGRMLFSELWVDPNAEEEHNRGGGGGKNTMRFLFKMDVQSLGLFDVILTAQGADVDVQIACPDAAVPFTKQIGDAVSQILTRNDLKPARVAVRRMDRPVTLTEVFPKIFEGKNSINVKI